MLHPVVVPVLRLAAHKLRARWRSWVILALLTGLAGGAVLTAAPARSAPRAPTRGC